MTTILICAFIAALLPYLAKAPVAYAMQKDGGYDNNHPRAQQARLTGFGARALAAHQNSFESLLIFALAIAVVLATNNIGSTVQTLAVIYIIARVFFCIFYYLNIDKLRSLVWLVSLLCPLAMIWLSIP
ncbi:MAPEG family protein [Pseudoalteromonas tunicata]|jgi:uncharacterized MAPEG superfamily protein|uniref:MAPEG family protein n=1 Tax=Pseudoalteromonas tunicata D2 TaxID=87626 RepID=A4CDY9_9GAMM|nr:MAPEG family protein [Pseudoalteromonas tunicata]ATC96326.1 hypothetical protein PTUN_a4104 [Pseudoalteromonas tunicata]AXT31831.1 MAPEG family protein [Pseudoalteromonas tunicata]EAR27181.1 hypothetical protein PTD2_05905 [Pseudoalteromonas tunicata D2]MDP5212239.1 MAPEG family protein [Pseudoalteromonas tunicata]